MTATLLAAGLAALPAQAQAPFTPAPVPAPPQDPAVAAVLAAVSPARIEQRIRTLVGFGTRHTASDTRSDSRGIGAARRWIERELRACSAATGGQLQVGTQVWTEPAGQRLAAPTELVNVVATLPGTSATGQARLLVVSGHYDSRNSDVMDAQGEAPGADDDASGTAVVMELACTMAAQRFDATLVFLAVPGEEQGLLGAAHWAREARRQGLRVEGMITNDIVGSPVGDFGQRAPKEIRLFADGVDPLLRLLVQAQANRPNAMDAAEADPAADVNRPDAATRAALQAIALAGGSEDLPTLQFGRHLKAAAEAHLPGFTVNLIQRRDRYLRGGDHLPFLERGYAAVRYTEPFENFRHQHQNLRREGDVQYGDLPEFVDFGYVADVARVNAAGLATLALAPQPPREVRLEAGELTNDSTLRWAANPEPAAQLAGYRVVWRRTDAAVWQHALDVGPAVTRVTVPVSKDNVVFGVQAVSARGHASLASFPLPAR
ncbi:M28 family metallopeptidase [Ideonella sp. DXS22W]|uniref:M28 family metallopeptidase n=1 Tax=Pseudaquabacterium inlustre TaxID=2984192 RepID=A0ABU9CLD5_9BURK